jgi:hypothetical protein
MADLRAQASRRSEKPVSRAAAVFIVLLWVSAAALGAWALASRFRPEA